MRKEDVLAIKYLYMIARSRTKGPSYARETVVLNREVASLAKERGVPYQKMWKMIVNRAYEILLELLAERFKDVKL